MPVITPNQVTEDKLSLNAVNGWFKHLGTVINIAIDVHSAKALVSLPEHTEAHAAWKLEDAVFGNWFAKVFWHRPMGGHGQTGSQMLVASAPLLANLAAQDTPTPSVPSQPPAAPPTTPSLRQKLLEQQISEKEGILARLQKLGEEMTISSVPPLATPAKLHSPAPVSTTQNDHEWKRERDDEILVNFRTRAAAEQGFAKGSTIVAVGPVKISWHTAQQLQARPQGVTVPSF
ncbi:uncharacterized protein BJ212DRAFT_1299191 [Suillus subaureus]|uniref:Uncharacterized protein n=1 Tax=Suillus subaureus TaxID=48587 RepID=A0A9P7JEE2_9AGAM|nr:uncharacterized protein BJ212DRAFT_1299191 [Suillus subaureus]KAG1817673.1 hypothetical protein BJ212DRAFT_1299191 [Suillus subaureus]